MNLAALAAFLTLMTDFSVEREKYIEHVAQGGKVLLYCHSILKIRVDFSSLLLNYFVFFPTPRYNPPP